MGHAANRWAMAAWVVLAAAVFAASAAAFRAADSVVPNDPYWSTQESLQHVGVPAVWSLTTGNPTIVIAVVDTGVEPVPDLAGALVPGWDFVEGDALPRDTHGHGTEVASLIAARGDDGEGIAGVCWACKLMPVRVASAGTTATDQLALGIRWAADHGARIINVSLVGSGDPSEEQAVGYAQARGALIVAAAGNSEGDTRPTYPAAYPGVLSVAATDADDRLYPWSTRGNWVSLAAPGCSVVDHLGAQPASLCGTSFAPALVSGVAGLLLSANPTLTAPSLAAALRTGAIPVAGIGGGRIDAAAASSALTDMPPPEAGPSYASEARLLRGTMRINWRTAIQLGPGPLVLELRSPRLAGCHVELRAPDGVLVALPTRRDEIRLAGTATGGRYVVAVSCSEPAPRKFTLLLYANMRR